MGDRIQDLERLVSALSEIRRRFRRDRADMLDSEYINPQVVMSPQEAFYAPKRALALADCAGQVCSEFVMSYPPGIPSWRPASDHRGDHPHHRVFQGQGLPLTAPKTRCYAYQCHREIEWETL
jgi:hypothetical protein